LKKVFFLYSVYLLNAQNAYQGELVFNYSGTETGIFSSITQDTIISGFCLSQDDSDTSSLLIASITQQPNDTYDLFLSVLRDTTYPLAPRTWEIPGEGDESNPLSLETLLIFMPGLDSAFVTQLFEIVTDTSSTDNSEDPLSDIFSTLTSDLYLGISGQLEITEVTDTSITGNFNTTMLKPAFYFPPHIISINNGVFNFSNVVVPDLNLSDNIPMHKNLLIKKMYPNPFNNSINIDILLGDDFNSVSLEIFDLNGKKIETIHSGQLKKGDMTFKWESGANSSGVYFIIIKNNTLIKSQKITLIK
tara:strand:- start:119 stop:1030 length:912 start_codon:yes stop_codon:yes gene_type:complete